MTTPKTASPELSTSQAAKEATANEAFRRIEAGASLYLVIDKDLSAPPGSCADGAQYIVAATGSGAWAGHTGKIAIAVGANAANGWYFRDPEEGVFAWLQDEDALYRCTLGTSPASWTPYVPAAGTINLNDLADVDLPSPTNGQVLTYDTNSPVGWKAETPSAGVTTLDGLSDVDVPSPTNGQVLTYDTNSPVGWKAVTPSAGPTTLDGLSDVDTSGAADGNALIYDANSPTTWRPGAYKPTESLIIACSDETTAIAAGTAKLTFRMPYAFTLTDVRASVTTAPTGSTIIIDINEAGVSVLSTKLSIDASEKTSTTAATPAVISDASLADDAEITIDFDQVGSTIAGAGVKVALIGHRA